MKNKSCNFQIYSCVISEGFLPASHGCIRMKNRDIIELFDRVKRGALVKISIE